MTSRSNIIKCDRHMWRQIDVKPLRIRTPAEYDRIDVKEVRYGD